MRRRIHIAAVIIVFLSILAVAVASRGPRKAVSTAASVHASAPVEPLLIDPFQTSKKITELNALTTPTSDDLLLMVNSPTSSAESMKITFANFQTTLLSSNVPLFSTTSVIKQSIGGADPLNPPHLVTPYLIKFGTAGAYADSGTGNIFHSSVWITNSGSRAAVAALFYAEATGATADVFPVNLVSYSSVSGGISAPEFDFGALASGGISYGLNIVNTGTFDTTGGFLQINAGSNAHKAGFGFRVAVVGGNQPISSSGNIFETVGAVVATGGIDISSATLTNAFKSTGFLVDGSGNITGQSIGGSLLQAATHQGGTGVGSTLTLKSTSGVGSTDAIIFQVGNNGATEAGRFITSGLFGVGTATPAALGQGGSFGSVIQIQGAATKYGVLNLANSSTTNGDQLGAISFASTGTAASDKRGVTILSNLAASSGTNVTANLSIFVNNAGTQINAFQISNVGITSHLKGGDVTSAAAIVPTGNLFHVTGTTTITSVTATGIVAGTTITIIFDGALTFTDGSNLKLAGNFVTTADDTITLTYDGSNWFELSRSIN